MTTTRRPASDPRTIARDIPGLFDALFPRLAQGIVVRFNRRSIPLDECQAVPPGLVAASKIQRAMLFEIAVVAAEQLIDGRITVDWDACLNTAVKRQREHFDAELPIALSNVDKKASLCVARNLVAMLAHLRTEADGETIVRAPRIPGYQWVASGVGDFSIGTTLIEVKCTDRHFVSSDYRQILMYWLLSYCAAIESGTPEWSQGILANPRLNLLVRFSSAKLSARPEWVGQNWSWSSYFLPC
jgi:hypothetical protein